MMRTNDRESESERCQLDGLFEQPTNKVDQGRHLMEQHDEMNSTKSWTFNQLSAHL